MAVQGSEYAFEDIKVVMGNRPIQTIQEIEYTEKQDKPVYHGQGNKPRGVGRGKKEYSGKIVMLQSDLEAMQRQLAPGKSVLDIKDIDIVCVYAPDGGVPTTDIMVDVNFTELKKGLKSGDGFPTVELPFVCVDIMYNN